MWPTFDAVHLATAELLGEPAPLVIIVTRDARVRDNARALGYTVESCTSVRLQVGEGKNQRCPEEAMGGSKEAGEEAVGSAPRFSASTEWYSRSTSLTSRSCEW